jgi:cyclic beta-1,2-glucan synthetase
VARVRRYRARRASLERAIETSGWDRAWYLRAWHDDGARIGSPQSDECRIDALVQAWATLSGAAPPVHAEQALDALEAHLIDDKAGIIRLLAPPFDRTPHDPGYIRGYLPGVRENGGQYTHAAVWVARAFAERGRRDRAARLLEMLSPVSHASSPEGVATYQVEPYVLAADVYGVAPHVGHGGWTWYTGSSGWMFRTAVESILGLQVEGGETIVLSPRIPDEWPRCAVTWKLPDGRAEYRIAIANPSGDAAAVVAATLDGKPVAITGGGARVPVIRDGGIHVVNLTLGGSDGTEPPPPKSLGR